MLNVGGASDSGQHLGDEPASRRRDRGRAYHPPMGYLALSLLFVLFLLALLPTRRLWVAGMGLGFRVGYLVTLLVLGLAAVEFEALGKYMVPGAARAVPVSVHRDPGLVGESTPPREPGRHHRGPRRAPRPRRAAEPLTPAFAGRGWHGGRSRQGGPGRPAGRRRLPSGQRPHHAAVNRDDLSVHVRRGRRQQEGGDPPDIGGFSVAAHRDGGDRPAPDLLDGDVARLRP